MKRTKNIILTSTIISASIALSACSEELKEAHSSYDNCRQVSKEECKGMTIENPATGSSHYVYVPFSSYYNSGGFYYPSATGNYMVGRANNSGQVIPTNIATPSAFSSMSGGRASIGNSVVSSSGFGSSAFSSMSGGG
jgi:hypothetical protein